MSRQNPKEEKTESSTTQSTASWLFFTAATSVVSSAVSFLTEQALTNVATPAIKATANTAGFVASTAINVAIPVAWWLTTAAAAGTVYVVKSAATGTYAFFFRSETGEMTPVQDLDDETANRLIRESGSLFDLPGDELLRAP